jgi:hypothetical protein
MVNSNENFDEIEKSAYAGLRPPNVTLDDWHFAVGNEMRCELFHIPTQKKWQKEFMLKATDGVAFETYLRPYSDGKGNIYFSGNYKTCFYSITPRSRNSLEVHMQNLDTGYENVRIIPKTAIDAAIKNNKRIPIQVL